MRVIYTYDEVSAAREHTGKCPVCGKRVRRRQTFTNTVNPFNINKATREPKTYYEVRDDVETEADAWVPDFTHEKCAS